MGIEIKIARIRKGLKQGELAHNVGISRYYLSALENEKIKNPSRKVMIDISRELDEPVEILFFKDK